MRLIVYTFFIATLLFFYSCDDEKRKNIKEYYYPVDDLKKGQVYEYRSMTNDTLPPMYWYYSSINTDSGKFLISNYYDHTFVNKQSVLEEIVSTGVLTKEYKLMSANPGEVGISIVDIEVVKDSAFPFSVKKDGGIFPMELKFKDPTDAQEDIRMIRQRKYLGDTIFTFKGKDIPAVIFSANEIREFTHSEKGDFDNTTFATEIYAKNIGLVSRKYNIGEIKMEYVLHERFGIEKLEKMASDFWGNEIDLIPGN